MGAMGDPVESIGQSPHDMQAQHLDLYHRPPEVANLSRPKSFRMAPHLTGEVIHHLAVPGYIAQLAGFPFVTHDGHRLRPTLARLSDHVSNGDSSAVEKNLTELLGNSVNHPKWPLFDAGLSHRNREGGDTPVLGNLTVGPSQHETPFSFIRIARPHFVAGDDVVVARALGPGAQGRQV